LKQSIKIHKRADFKITLWYSLTFFISIFILALFLNYRLSHNLIKEIDRFITDESNEFLAEIDQEKNDLKKIQKRFDQTIAGREFYKIYYRILDHKGKTVIASKNFGDIGYRKDINFLTRLKKKHLIKETFHSPYHRNPFRIHSFLFDSTINKEIYAIQIGTYLKHYNKTMSNFQNNIIIAIPLALLIACVGGWLFARRVLVPISKITKEAQHLSISNLDKRLIPSGTGDEIDELIYALNQMISRIEESYLKISQFSADVSHELKTPLAVLKGETERILSTSRKRDEYQDHLYNLVRKIDELIELTNNLLFLAKVDSGQWRKPDDEIAIDNELLKVIDLFQGLANDKGIKLSYLPLPHLLVKGEKFRIQQLFTHLIDNSIKYSLPGGEIEISLKKENGWSVFTIKDTGIGISKEDLPKIFDRFFRVERSRSRQTGGTGLGLSLCKKIVEIHGGKIIVESELGKGSTFTVFLPLVNPS